MRFSIENLLKTCTRFVTYISNRFHLPRKFMNSMEKHDFLPSTCVLILSSKFLYILCESNSSSFRRKYLFSISSAYFPESRANQLAIIHFNFCTYLVIYEMAHSFDSSCWIVKNHCLFSFYLNFINCWQN